MIQFFHVSKRFDRMVAVKDVTFHIEKGERVLLTGPSGAGKTTLLKLIFGADTPDEGQILVQNRNIGRLRASDIPHLRRSMGFVLQDFKLLPKKSVYENVVLPLIIQGGTGPEVKKKVTEALKAVGMDHKRATQTGVLSAGEQQRVCIARAVVNSPIILLADEPTGNLDTNLTVEIVDLFKTINARGTTVLMATHNRQVVEQMNGRVIHLHSGRILSDQGSMT
jgi:cell division transport system ATP-binding protein